MIADTLSRYPSIAATSGVATIAAKLADIITGPLEVIITLGTAIIVVMTAIIKTKEVVSKWRS